MQELENDKKYLTKNINIIHKRITEVADVNIYKE
jgi:hypothetical protein